MRVHLSLYIQKLHTKIPYEIEVSYEVEVFEFNKPKKIASTGKCIKETEAWKKAVEICEGQGWKAITLDVFKR